ncbi:hypothetical protein [Nocardia rhizosphaerihabitans]|uniref:D-alanyl-D-alanine carboxypeptidase n=1 Tax=Nocardia rhizosphaerihabitans TaxID=1691570 RepID=A0ABQ2KSU7_9NOCA|nr:hypothetical protein [Nocardia rhizosphaerihabitans]GGN90460.1 hypothetical protein GCM10011610_49600 [Nocardia rhizosphaerihabitans]
MSITITLTDQDKATLRTAAYGAVSLIAAAGAPHRGISHGSIALTSATGLVGHVLAAKSKDIHLPGKSVAALADQVLPSLTAAMSMLAEQDPAEAGNFRDTVLVAVEAATQADKGQPTPAVAAMARKIAAALDAA